MSSLHMLTPINAACPRCGSVLELVPHPGRPGRLVGRCRCNPLGPVIETNVKKASKPVLREEVGNDSTIR